MSPLFSAILAALGAAWLTWLLLRARLRRHDRRLRQWDQLARDVLTAEGIPHTEVTDAGHRGHLPNLLRDTLHRHRRNSARRRAILQSMGEGVALVDGRAYLVTFNPSFQTLYRLGEEHKGTPFSECVPETRLQEVVARVIDTRRPGNLELELPTTPPRYLHFSASPYHDQEAGQGVIVVVHDITSLKRAEVVRTEFVANVSHELRTPLAAIRGYIETAQEECEDPETTRRFLKVIDTHSQRLSALIEDLLALSRLESKDRDLPMGPTSLPKVLEIVLHTVGPLVAERGFQIDNQVAPDTPLIQANQEALERVLINLVENAIKYSEPGRTVSVSATTVVDRLRVAVRDEGVGIAREDQQRIFERFYRVDRARSRQAGGTGLGLSIVKHAVLAHGGEVWVDSVPGEGSTFFFTIPLATGAPYSSTS